MFAAFPDDHAQLRREAIAFYRFETTRFGREAAAGGIAPDLRIEDLIAAGFVTAEP